MINSFLSLTKIIYFNQKISILNIKRLIDILLHARKYLDSKIVENYHNIWLMIGILIKKCSNYEDYSIEK